MSDDILDLFGGKYGSSSKGREAKDVPSPAYLSHNYSRSTNTSSTAATNGPRAAYSSGNSSTNAAPIELMNKFLLCVTENRMKEALALCDEILTYEPTNRIVLEYQPALREYIKQGFDQPKEVEEEEEDEEEEDEEGSEEEGKGNDSEDESDKENDDYENESKREESKR